MRKFYFLSMFMLLSVINVHAQPVVAAPVPPARDAADVISLFSNAYTNVTVDTWSAGWDQADVADILVAGNDTKVYTNLNYCGIEFTLGTLNVSSMGYYHIDVWTPNATPVKVKLVDFGANGTYGGGDDKESVEYVLTPAPALSSWASFDIPMSSFTGLDTKAHLAQMLFVSSANTVYVDNIYFWKSSSTPSLSNFSVPAKMVGDAAFALTAPTSNSPGTFSYTSANTSVATISGDMVTIVGAGTSLITATQAAAGGYTAASISASLVVTYPSPAVAAPTPARNASGVISLFSNAYTNVPVDTWSAVWDAADVTDIQVAGNDTKKYTGLQYAGIEFTNPVINATSMEYFHIDVYTTDGGPVKVKLVDFGANGSYDGGDDKVSIEYELSPAPTPATWSGYDIPLSSFTGLDTKAHLAQMVLIGSGTLYIDNVYLFSGSLLPVKITGFKVIADHYTAILQWSSVSEQNNSGFSIERSANTTSWTEIQYVKANNGTASRNYSVTDSRPLNGINYYRIKQVDINGVITYSPVLSATFNDNGTAIFFSPNPARGSLIINIQKIGNNNTSLSLVNTSGQKVLSMMLKKETEKSQLKMDISKLPVGVYMVVLNDGHSVQSQKLVIE